LHLAGRGPNSNSLFLPQAAVVAVALGDGAFGSTDNFPVLPRAPSLRELASRSDD